ncbi:hypothetical protein NJT12_00150 [Flavobacterium sp. AC]|uniref:Uncharacterized protein n=1 Tax=Flavobacterium azizsancarii TaxID=2961580 RepID=A0ABT4W5X6_9FLAO|nr:hypothetical protein [Flavobacterium azizsancarii]MDA6068013.1 hypothetical protein [Flavobacterium azizsancarii]
MILGFSTQINGKPTHFVEKIWKGLKENISDELRIQQEAKMTPEELTTPYEVDSEVYPGVKAKLHTIREDKKDRWEKGKNIDFFINCRKKDMKRFAPVLPVVRTQSIFMTYYHSDIIQISVNGKELFGYNERLELALNDGFDSWEDFFDYFYPIIQASDDKSFSGKIIHWTDLKY